MATSAQLFIGESDGILTRPLSLTIASDRAVLGELAAVVVVGATDAGLSSRGGGGGVAGFSVLSAVERTRPRGPHSPCSSAGLFPLAGVAITSVLRCEKTDEDMLLSVEL